MIELIFAFSVYNAHKSFAFDFAQPPFLEDLIHFGDGDFEFEQKISCTGIFPVSSIFLGRNILHISRRNVLIIKDGDFESEKNILCFWE